MRRFNRRVNRQQVSLVGEALDVINILINLSQHRDQLLSVIKPFICMLTDIIQHTAQLLHITAGFTVMHGDFIQCPLFPRQAGTGIQQGVADNFYRRDTIQQVTAQNFTVIVLLFIRISRHHVL